MSKCLTLNLGSLAPSSGVTPFTIDVDGDDINFGGIVIPFTPNTATTNVEINYTLDSEAHSYTFEDANVPIAMTIPTHGSSLVLDDTFSNRCQYYIDTKKTEIALTNPPAVLYCPILTSVTHSISVEPAILIVGADRIDSGLLTICWPDAVTPTIRMTNYYLWYKIVVCGLTVTYSWASLNGTWITPCP